MCFIISTTLLILHYCMWRQRWFMKQTGVILTFLREWVFCCYFNELGEFLRKIWRRWILPELWARYCTFHVDMMAQNLLSCFASTTFCRQTERLSTPLPLSTQQCNKYMTHLKCIKSIPSSFCPGIMTSDVLCTSFFYIIKWYNK